jgi:uncharacterized protein (TIGR00661 family)
MARIAISVCGEGRGHASRIVALVDRLGHDHEVLLYATADGYEFLRRQFEGQRGRVEVRQNPGIVFQYSAGRLHVLRSIAAGFDFQARELGPLVDRLTRELEAFGAELAITDFEPTLPRAARRRRIPLVSVDHQHFLRAYELKSLPRALQWNAWSMSYAVWMYVVQPSDIVVSAFFRPRLRRGWQHVVQVGPLLRTSLLRAVPEDGGFVLSYLRRHTPLAAIEALAGCGTPVKVYGLGRRTPVGCVTFHEIDERQFVDDLAGCSAVVAAAGNQLIGESLHLGKPMLVLPERAHAEQRINAHFLAGMGCGEFTLLEEVTDERIRAFLESRERYADGLACVAGCMDGTPEVLRVIHDRLQRSSSHGDRHPSRVLLHGDDGNRG